MQLTYDEGYFYHEAVKLTKKDFKIPVAGFSL
jgi:hypothetical protein